MPAPVQVLAAAEDFLLARMAEKLLLLSGDKYQLLGGKVSTLGGCRKVDERIPKWNQSAESPGNAYLHLILRDLDSLAPPDDNGKCPESMSVTLLKNAPHSPDFLLRFAVFEAESWLLADSSALAKFLRIRREIRVSSADSLKNPKEQIISFARESRQRDIREGIPPRQGSTAKIGPLYNHLLGEFIRNKWDPKRAAKRSKSLRRTLNRLQNFVPVSDAPKSPRLV